MLNKINTSIITPFFFMLVILSDFHYKLLSFGYLNTIKFTLIIKVVIGFFYCSKILTKINKFRLILILILFSCGTFSTLFFSINSYVLGQYYFTIIICIYFFTNKDKFLSKNLLKFIEAIIVLNFVFILLGYFLEIDFFRTYRGARFGYNGILKGTSVASYFYMFSTLLFMFRKQKSVLNNFFLFISMTSSLFIGSKTLYAFVVFSAIVIFLRYLLENNKKLNVKRVYLATAGGILLLSVFFFKPLFSLNKTIEQVLNREGIITAFFSYRDIHFINAINDIKEEYNFFNYMFGGICKINRLAEMALMDLFLTFGIVGSFVYCSILVSVFPKIIDFSLKIMLTFVLILIFLRGNFLYFPSDIFISITIFAVVVEEMYDTNKGKT